MGKEKKITIRFYPKSISEDGSASNIYARVTYDRLTTRFNTNFYSVIDVEKLEGKFINTEDNPYLEKYSKWLENLIKNEIIFFGDNYIITGIKERIDFYSSLLLNFYLIHTVTRNKEYVKTIFTYSQYEAYKKLAGSISGAYSFYIFCKSIMIMSEGIEQDVSYIVDNQTLESLYIISNLICFEIDSNPQHYIGDGEGFINFVGVTNIGSWIANNEGCKHKFIDYVNSNDCFAVLEKYKIGIHPTLVKAINEHKISSLKIIENIDSVIDSLNIMKRGI